jgi:hypothetical protein
MAEDDYSWIITPLLGAAGLLAAYIFSGASNQNQQPSLPPPPVNQKPSGCGCSKKT